MGYFPFPTFLLTLLSTWVGLLGSLPSKLLALESLSEGKLLEEAKRRCTRFNAFMFTICPWMGYVLPSLQLATLTRLTLVFCLH